MVGQVNPIPVPVILAAVNGDEDALAAMVAHYLGLDSIAMIRKSSKSRYEYNGEQLSLQKIYGISKKRRGCNKYLLSADVMLGKDQKIPARIVCVRNKKKKKDWITLICTDMNLTPKEIIQIYGKRWKIEVFFKTRKSYLNLIEECHSLSYGALTAHIAIIFARYMIIAFEQRKIRMNEHSVNSFSISWMNYSTLHLLNRIRFC